jgi:hypothetical protein
MRIRGPTTAIRSLVASVFGIALAAGACASQVTPRWVDVGVHPVDGYWILAEQPCDGAADACGDVVRAAVPALGVDPKTIVRSWTAGLPVEWMRSDGRVASVLFNTSGFEQFVVLDLADGSRRVIGVGCGMPNPDGSARCLPSSLESYRVGLQPID